MTDHRVGYSSYNLPVVMDGTLAGIVSIGDVVKKRIDELETERSALAKYISGTR